MEALAKALAANPKITEFLDKEAAAQDARRVELGVEDAVLEIEGVTLPIAVALGEGEVKSVEDLAGLIPDDLRGWFETRDGERVREPGVLEAFNLSPDDAEALIMRARVIMGWVEAPPEPEYEEEFVSEGLDNPGDYDLAAAEGEASDA
jgi:N utilization substance protein A